METAIHQQVVVATENYNALLRKSLSSKGLTHEGELKLNKAKTNLDNLDRAVSRADVAIQLVKSRLKQFFDSASTGVAKFGRDAERHSLNRALEQLRRAIRDVNLQSSQKLPGILDIDLSLKKLIYDIQHKDKESSFKRIREFNRPDSNFNLRSTLPLRSSSPHPQGPAKRLEPRKLQRSPSSSSTSSGGSSSRGSGKSDRDKRPGSPSSQPPRPAGLPSTPQSGRQTPVPITPGSLDKKHIKGGGTPVSLSGGAQGGTGFPAAFTPTPQQPGRQPPLPTPSGAIGKKQQFGGGGSQAVGKSDTDKRPGSPGAKAPSPAAFPPTSQQPGRQPPLPIGGGGAGLDTSEKYKTKARQQQHPVPAVQPPSPPPSKEREKQKDDAQGPSGTHRPPLSRKSSDEFNIPPIFSRTGSTSSSTGAGSGTESSRTTTNAYDSKSSDESESSNRASRRKEERKQQREERRKARLKAQYEKALSDERQRHLLREEHLQGIIDQQKQHVSAIEQSYDSRSEKELERNQKWQSLLEQQKRESEFQIQRAFEEGQSGGLKEKQAAHENMLNQFRDALRDQQNKYEAFIKERDAERAAEYDAAIKELEGRYRRFGQEQAHEIDRQVFIRTQQLQNHYAQLQKENEALKAERDGRKRKHEDADSAEVKRLQGLLLERDKRIDELNVDNIRLVHSLTSTHKAAEAANANNEKMRQQLQSNLSDLPQPEPDFDAVSHASHDSRDSRDSQRSGKSRDSSKNKEDQDFDDAGSSVAAENEDIDHSKDEQIDRLNEQLSEFKKELDAALAARVQDASTIKGLLNDRQVATDTAGQYAWELEAARKEIADMQREQSEQYKMYIAQMQLRKSQFENLSQAFNKSEAEKAAAQAAQKVAEENAMKVKQESQKELEALRAVLLDTQHKDNKHIAGGGGKPSKREEKELADPAAAAAAALAAAREAAMKSEIGQLKADLDRMHAQKLAQEQQAQAYQKDAEAASKKLQDQYQAQQKDFQAEMAKLRLEFDKLRLEREALGGQLKDALWRREQDKSAIEAARAEAAKALASVAAANAAAAAATAAAADDRKSRLDDQKRIKELEYHIATMRGQGKQY